MTKPLLASEGFEPFDRKLVGIPFYVWVLNIDLEVSRHLQASEEAVLGLLDLGITARADLARLLGLEGEALFSDLIIDLVRSGGVEMRQDGFALTQAGRLMLRSAARKEIRRSEGVRVRYDPYGDSFSTVMEEDEVRDARAEGLEELALDANLTPQKVTSRLDELTRALRQGEPETREAETRLRVLRFDPVRTYTVYQRAELEVWYRTSDRTWAWRLTDVGEETRLSDKLRELEAEQVDSTIIPRHRPVPPPRTSFAAFMRSTFDFLEDSDAAWTPDFTLKERVREVVAEAKERALITFPMFPQREDDQELIDLLLDCLKRRKGLRIALVLSNTRKGVAKTGQALQTALEKADASHDRLEVIEIREVLGDESLVISEGEVLVAAQDSLPLKAGGNYVVTRFGGRYTQDKDLVKLVWSRVGTPLEGAR